MQPKNSFFYNLYNIAQHSHLTCKMVLAGKERLCFIWWFIYFLLSIILQCISSMNVDGGVWAVTIVWKCFGQVLEMAPNPPIVLRVRSCMCKSNNGSWYIYYHGSQKDWKQIKYPLIKPPVIGRFFPKTLVLWDFEISKTSGSLFFIF